jgi:hypothetical protein
MNESVYIFLVDRTGSMQGRKLEITKEALKLFIKSLPAGCLFEIVSFGYNFLCGNRYLFLSPDKKGLINNDENMEVVRKQIDEMYANGSCENIFEPLQDVFKYFGKPVIGAPTYVQKTESD